MDIPPTIPTSFVPRPSSAVARQFSAHSTNTFSIFAYAVFGIVFTLSVGIFFYGRILAGTLAAKEIELTKAEKAIDLATVKGFVQLRDRLNSGTVLLANHVAFSNFFSLLETLLPSTVRLTTLHLALDTTKKVKFDGSGTAKNFNALAAVSSSFAADGHIKEAIFSNLVVNKDGSVSFILSATLDPKTVAFSP